MLLAAETRTLAPFAELALALAPPKRASAVDDGLLTASEVAQLQLDADWVLLSACNTASGANDNAEGLSGLARAFLYAGSRALLVSHWAVETKSAKQLTTGTMRAFAAADHPSRAEALRRSVLQLLDGKVAAYYVHPFFWAPFIIVGEGGYSPKGRGAGYE